MSDLAKKLRFTAEIAPPADKFTSLVPEGRKLLIEAAGRIEELEATLRDAIKSHGKIPANIPVPKWVDAARAVLEGKSND